MGRATGTLPPDVCKQVVARLEEAPVRLAVLFGSYATGDATGGSDIDIGIAYESDTPDVTDTHLSLVADLTRIFGRDDVDVVRMTAVDPRIAAEALDHGRRLVGSEGDISELRDHIERNRREREETVNDRISRAEQAIQQRLDRREHG